MAKRVPDLHRPKFAEQSVTFPGGQKTRPALSHRQVDMRSPQVNGPLQPQAGPWSGRQSPALTQDNGVRTSSASASYKSGREAQGLATRLSLPLDPRQTSILNHSSPPAGTYRCGHCLNRTLDQAQKTRKRPPLFRKLRLEVGVRVTNGLSDPTNH